MRIFITGLSGSLGTALANYHHGQGDQVWGCSRSESRAVEWLRKYSHLGTLLLQSTRTIHKKNDTNRLLSTMDRVYHCAAMKHVNLCEEQPATALMQNVMFTTSVVIACDAYKVPVVFASSDKACMSQGVYGATKLIGERIVMKYGGSVVRLVNLIGSSGSVFDIWKKQVEEGKPITITDPEMTRYFMPVRTAAQFMAEHCVPGRVVIPYCRSVKMGDVVNHMTHDITTVEPRWVVTGIRPGEVRHQCLIAAGDVVEIDHYKHILGQGTVWAKGKSSEDGPFWDVKELLAEVNANDRK